MTTLPRIAIHATSVVLGEAAAPFGAALDAAVLLLGSSGSGKSDVALRLIAMGARLVSDDQTALYVEDGRLYAEAPPSLHGQIEIRGTGIVKLNAAGPTLVVLAVYLEPERNIERLPEPISYRLPPPLYALVPPPLLTLRPFEASTPAKIAAAAAAVARGTFVAGASSPSSAPFL
jgi:HPr kinase/phosphorylase